MTGYSEYAKVQCVLNHHQGQPTVLNIEQEVWKPIKEFESLYVVSSLGRISNHRKILAIQTLPKGYKTIVFKWILIKLANYQVNFSYRFQKFFSTKFIKKK